MNKVGWMWLGVMLMYCTGLHGAVINVGQWDIPVGATSFEIPVAIQSDANETVSDMVLRIQVADGGPQLGGVVEGPAIVGIDYAGSIWNESPFNASFSPNLATGDFRQLVQSDVSIDFNSGVPVAVNGVLATIVVDVSGLDPGQSFDLLLTGTRAGGTLFLGLDDNVQINNGSINVVPEPTSLLLLSVGSLYWFSRRRWPVCHTCVAQ